ncbi:hypothetical protein N7492_005488 [Penicillium capsulatum]|uniref:Laminarinase eglC n=1 Tax=Penicillium capsulatum TaxID=69766 RepID=A0A9W9ICC9_9EURO|nr:hypothetical protein N7492_005488 [Penicillium capsulatum]
MRPNMNSLELENCGALQDSAQAHAATEVVVWVDEHGEQLRVETNTAHTVTTTVQKNVGTRPQEDATRTDSPAPNGIVDQQPHRDGPGPGPGPGHPPPHPKPHQPPKPKHPPHPHPHPKPDHKPHQFGISYSPYNADRSCKSQAQVNNDFDQLSANAFVRIYGTDCEQTKTVTTAARQHKMQVFAGIYDLTDFPNSLKPFSEAATLPSGDKDWSIFHTIAIGNELVNGGHNSPGEVTDAVNKARPILREQGYKGPVVTVDTFSQLLQHPELCHVSDYCAANCHAFFDATQQPHHAGPYALEQAHSVSDAAGGKRTIITESGWPHGGDANGAAVPSPENQDVALASLRRSFAHRSEDLVLFTAFDDLWKEDNQWTFNAERFWGIHR